MSNQVDAEVKGIFDEALARYKKGEKTYGVFDKDNDPRNFLKEAEEELLDVMNYAAFEIARIRAINARLNQVLGALQARLIRGGDHDHVGRNMELNIMGPVIDHDRFARELAPYIGIDHADPDPVPAEDPHYEPLPENEEPTL